ncbi:CHRD domain-containing protein [Paenibacillus glacialis]|uniref:CHRD domain-containing protein n=1 Tax=Paenibacillus glacialis TaxID=494026 RepID=A0A168KP55_9BACL|nr:CHRD domain-containing protein [Paenibacillus glacialis]OAB42285.1 CHRD domain-containing protein [Paenibacillus glacialis]
MERLINTFRARLNGRNEVPRVRTRATGDASFELLSSGTRLRFQLNIRNISGVTQAHIHLGRRGQNGPVVAFLFGPSKFGISVRQGVVRGVLTNRDLVGPLQGKTIRDLVREFRNGNAYVNVHTIQHPDGEIRGQVIH